MGEFTQYLRWTVSDTTNLQLHAKPATEPQRTILRPRQTQARAYLARTLAATLQAPCMDMPRSLERETQRLARLVASCSRHTNSFNNRVQAYLRKLESQLKCRVGARAEGQGTRAGPQHIKGRTGLTGSASHRAAEHVPETVRRNDQHLVVGAALHA